MSTVYRSNRKAHDDDIIKMNAVGLSLATIARTLNVHPTTVTLRLRSLCIEPTDTRRTFMENVLASMPPHITEWLADQLTPGNEIREYVRNLIIKEYKSNLKESSNSEK